MGRAWRDFLVRHLAREVTVPILSCVHFCGFRYGRQSYHPYESYARARGAGVDLAVARERFVHFVQYYRPRHLGEALGLTLEREYPLWFYPWDKAAPAPSWHDNPEDCPDVLTHFSAKGVAWSRVHMEFDWLENAWQSLREHGYQPARFRSFIHARRFVLQDGRQAHLILDGNHRISALSALGEEQVAVRMFDRSVVREAELERWPQVRNGRFVASDARQVLHAYFTGNSRDETTAQPAPLLGAGP